MKLPTESLPLPLPASRIAAALGIGSRAVLAALKDVPSIPGRYGAKEWRFADLPDQLRKRLHREARQRNYRDAFSLLSHSREDAPVPVPAPPRQARASSGRVDSLQSVIAGFVKPTEPTCAEQRFLWDCAFTLLDEGADKRELIDFLAHHTPFLARNAEALKRNFNRLFQRWQTDGGQLAALDDKRNGRPRGPELTDDEFKLLVAYAAKYGGGCDQAWRETLRLGKLRQEIVSYYINQRRRMPEKFSELIRHAAADARNRLHGPRHAELTGPYIRRDPNHPANPLRSGQFDQSDDLTCPNVFYDQREDGTFWVGQGQFLAWVDERSWMVYNFVLIPERGYSAFHIRNSWTRKCDEHGLPTEGLYLEGSYWQSARVWVGRRDEVSWSETEMGIRRLGLRIKHAMYPKGKIIERIFGDLQNHFQKERGYVGRNPITDKYEEVQKQIRLVNAGHAHPSEFFLSKAQWTERLEEMCQLYNQTEKYGRYHDGLTPQQTYEKYFVGELVKIPDNCRYLLASNKIEATIGRNGLSFQYGKLRFIYKGEQLGRMKFKDPRVIAWFNPEDPTVLGVTDRNGENPIVVRQATDLPSHDAPAELMAQARRENAEFVRPGKELYRSLKPIFSEEFGQRRFRPVLSDGLAAETGRAFEEQGRGAREEQRAQDKLANRARRHGIKVSPRDPRFSQRVNAAAELDALLAKADSETPTEER